MTRVSWIGHATVLIETGGRRILTDPVLGAGIGPVRRRTPGLPIDLDRLDAVLISHLHHDHLDLPSLRRLGQDVPIVVATGAGDLMRSNGFEAVRELAPGDGTTVGDVTIRAVPALHSGKRMPIGPTVEALGFVIDGEHRVYFAGDTNVFPEMTDIAPDLDLAILPVGGWGPTLRGGHMDPVRAAEALTLLRPRAALPVHWGTLWPVGMSAVRRSRFEEPARQFQDEAARVAPDVVVTIVDPGGHMVLGNDGSIEVAAMSSAPD
jgi:L-ascorbate metabolism protein UlaG (beta-lactamase superfamily)